MVERFNGRMADVLKTHRNMEQTLLRYVALYNHQLPQSALGSKAPMRVMKEWCQEHPDLFHKRPYDRPGCETCSNPSDISRRQKPRQTTAGAGNTRATSPSRVLGRCNVVAR